MLAAGLTPFWYRNCEGTTRASVTRSDACESGPTTHDLFLQRKRGEPTSCLLEVGVRGGAAAPRAARKVHGCRRPVGASLQRRRPGRETTLKPRPRYRGGDEWRDVVGVDDVLGSSVVRRSTCISRTGGRAGRRPGSAGWWLAAASSSTNRRRPAGRRRGPAHVRSGLGSRDFACSPTLPARCCWSTATKLSFRAGATQAGPGCRPGGDPRELTGGTAWRDPRWRRGLCFSSSIAGAAPYSAPPAHPAPGSIMAVAAHWNELVNGQRTDGTVANTGVGARQHPAEGDADWKWHNESLTHDVGINVTRTHVREGPRSMFGSTGNERKMTLFHFSPMPMWRRQRWSTGSRRFSPEQHSDPNSTSSRFMSTRPMVIMPETLPTHTIPAACRPGFTLCGWPPLHQGAGLTALLISVGADVDIITGAAELFTAAVIGMLPWHRAGHQAGARQTDANLVMRPGQLHEVRQRTWLKRRACLPITSTGG